jgi:CelD/BcsL family acetyltransferase involved in cellulose biosynthesis
MYNPHTPRYDFIVGNDQDPRLYSAIWKELLRNGQSDAVILSQVPSSSATLHTLQTLATHDGWLAGRWQAPAAPYIRLARDYESFASSLKNSCRNNLRKRFERLKRTGSVDVEVIRDPQGVRAAMNEGLRIEASAWKGQQGTAISSDPVVADFYMRLAEREAELGRLQLTFLRVNGKRIAFSYLLRSGRKIYAVKIGYDRDYRMYSPGNMLLNLVLQDACAKDLEEYDFLGSDDDWKFEWTKEKREHQWLFLFKDTLRARMLHYLKFNVAPGVRPALARLHMKS